MKLIALTGGIASGKSTVGRRLESLGAIRIDADQLAREAVTPGSAGLEDVRRRFGTSVLTDEGSLDRAALGALVFEDPDALGALNDIVHPRVRELADARIATIRREHPDAIVVYEIPLLVESEVSLAWDLVVVTEAPTQMRIERLTQLRGMTAADARHRIERQAGDDERRAIADIVIDTSGSEAETLAQADALWHRLTAAPSQGAG